MSSTSARTSRLRDNNITVDLTGYTLGWFDMSVLWSNSMDGRYQDNSFTVIEPTTNTFVAQTAIEFQGHRNTVAGNKTTGSSKFRNGVIFTANTYIDPLATYYPGWPKGADDNVIENNRMTVTRFGVEIWGMAVTSPAPMQRTRIRRNAFTINNVGVAAAGALVSMYLGTPGAPGNDGTQTSPLIDLKISDNVVTYAVRRVSGVYSSADSAVRLYTEVALTGVQVINNTVDNCGGFGVLAYVADASSAWIDGLDVTSNKFVNVREPVRIVRNTKNWRVAEGNVFSQTSIYGTLTDNMIETVAARSGSQTDGTVRGNMIRCAAGHKPFYPIRNQGIAEAFYPASSGFVVEQMGVQARGAHADGHGRLERSGAPGRGHVRQVTVRGGRDPRHPDRRGRWCRRHHVGDGRANDDSQRRHEHPARSGSRDPVQCAVRVGIGGRGRCSGERRVHGREPSGGGCGSRVV